MAMSRFVKETSIVYGGNDFQSGGNGNDKLYGDAEIVDATATLIGGHDTLNGDGGNDFLYGDAQTLSASSIGGNDNLIGGAGGDTMFGDAEIMNGAQGGDDMLNTAIGGQNPDGVKDTVYGNSGADLFVVGNNYDSTDIMDFNDLEGDRIVGNTNEQKQIEGQLNAILLKGNGKQ